MESKEIAWNGIARGKSPSKSKELWSGSEYLWLIRLIRVRSSSKCKLWWWWWSSVPSNSKRCQAGYQMLFRTISRWCHFAPLEIWYQIHVSVLDWSKGIEYPRMHTSWWGRSRRIYPNNWPDPVNFESIAIRP